MERNQQWQAYDGQREARVKGLLARMSWLEEQLERANESLSRHKEAHSDGEPCGRRGDSGKWPLAHTETSANTRDKHPVTDCHNREINISIEHFSQESTGI